MRALCEACSAPQPAAWQAGDLCIRCGQAVRREVRCFWCAKWTPLAKYCRSCGAECVDDRLYGAARMLKEAGTDRFTVPKLLKELDPDQVENFGRIYQVQGAIVARHVDDARALERHLHHRTFSVALEETLIPQLPWNEQTLAAMKPPLLPAGDDLALATTLQNASPLPLIRDLALLVRLHLGDWNARRAVGGLLHHADPLVRDETALLLGGWRVRTACGPGNDDREVAEVLRVSPGGAHATVRLAAMSRTPAPLPQEVLESTDPEVRFHAALIAGERDRLVAALAEDELHVIAAGRALVRLGDTAPLGRILRDGSAEAKAELVAALAGARKPAPALNQPLLELAEAATDERLRERAIRVICHAIPPGWCLRLARAGQGDRSVFQALLQIAELTADELMDLLGFQVDGRVFRHAQYGLSDVVRKNRLPLDAVPRLFPRADHDGRKELCRLAEDQLRESGDEALQRFLYGVAYGDHPGDLRAAAWSCLYRHYRRDDPRAEGILKLEPAAIARVFGSVPAFIPRLTAVLDDHATLKEVMLYDHLAPLLGHFDAAIVPALHAEEAATHRLVQALLRVFEERDYYAFLRQGAVKLLGGIGNHPRWRDEVVARLQARLDGDGYDLVYWAKRSLATITGGPMPP
jgi:hypothetical protein